VLELDLAKMQVNNEQKRPFVQNYSGELVPER